MLKNGVNINVAHTDIAGNMIEISQAESKVAVAESKVVVAESMLAQEKLKNQVSELQTKVCKMELANIKDKIATAKLADASITSRQPQHTNTYRRFRKKSAMHDVQGEHANPQDVQVQHEVDDKKEPSVHHASDDPMCAQDAHNSVTDSKDVDQSSEADLESPLDKPCAPDRLHDASEQTKSVPAQKQVSELTEESHTTNSTPEYFEPQVVRAQHEADAPDLNEDASDPTNTQVSKLTEEPRASNSPPITDQIIDEQKEFASGGAGMQMELPVINEPNGAEDNICPADGEIDKKGADIESTLHGDSTKSQLEPDIPTNKQVDDANEHETPVNVHDGYFEPQDVPAQHEVDAPDRDEDASEQGRLVDGEHVVEEADTKDVSTHQLQDAATYKQVSEVTEEPRVSPNTDRQHECASECMHDDGKQNEGHGSPSEITEKKVANCNVWLTADAMNAVRERLLTNEKNGAEINFHTYKNDAETDVEDQDEDQDEDEDQNEDEDQDEDEDEDARLKRQRNMARATSRKEKKMEEDIAAKRLDEERTAKIEHQMHLREVRIIKRRSKFVAYATAKHQRAC